MYIIVYIRSILSYKYIYNVNNIPDITPYLVK